MNRRHPLAALAAAVILAAAPLTALSTPTANAASCSASNHTRGDVDGDGVSDLAVGVKELDSGKGGVDLNLSSGGRVLIQPQFYGLPASGPNDSFGSSVLLEDIDHNGCADVFVGARGRAQVYLFTSVGGHLTYKGSIVGAAGSGAGASMTAINGNRIAIGMPANGAGAVLIAEFSAAGDLISSNVLSQDTPGVPGVSEPEEEFGGVLAGTGNTVVVGTPFEGVGSIRRAGSVTFLTLGTSGTALVSAKVITQDTPGVPGKAEQWDTFGHSLATLGNRILIGVPGESIGADYDTGMVQPGLFQEATNTYTPWPVIHQDVSGVAGTNEDMDLFGWSVALGRNTFNGVTAIIGAHGEKVGSVLGGAVTLVKLRSTAGTMSSVALTENSAGVPDVTQTGDYFGYKVSILPGNPDDGAAVLDRVAISAPNDSGGTNVNLGRVFISPPRNGRWTMLRPGILRTDPFGYGRALSSAGMNP